MEKELVVSYPDADMELDNDDVESVIEEEQEDGVLQKDSQVIMEALEDAIDDESSEIVDTGDAILVSIALVGGGTTVDRVCRNFLFGFTIIVAILVES